MERLLARLFRHRTIRASVEEDLPRAIGLSHPRGSKRANLRSRFIENGAAGEPEFASSVRYNALGLPTKGAIADLKNSDQLATTSCFPCIVFRRPKN